LPPLQIALIGAGGRGANAYGDYALHHPNDIRFVAVAEPISERRERFAALHDIPRDRQFSTWEDLLVRPRLADALIIATQDQQHTAPTLAALHAGYPVLLEKPMATTLEECVTLVRTAESTGQPLLICHVLRYTAFFSTLYQIVQSGRLGDVITVEHRENVAYWHMAHSFVRGHWRNKEYSSPMILAKCCHDLDLLYWILGQPVTRLSSVGSLRHFRPDQAPRADVPQRCLDGCPVAEECPYYAPGIYLEHRPWGEAGKTRTWPMTALAHGNLDPDAIRQALQEGPYGRCVYHCDNDVVDHQIVLMENAASTSIALCMHGHSHQEGRTLRYDGTRATLRGIFSSECSEITIHDHPTNTVERIDFTEGIGGHGGGDTGLMDAFVQALRGEQSPLTSGRASLESHLMAFAAEQARLERTVIDMNAFRAAAY